MEVSFEVSREDAALIQRIVERGRRMIRDDPEVSEVWGERGAVDWTLDVTATHANGCTLDLQKFLDFDDFNFAHDFFGIANCIDRRTGKMTRCFLPRCAR